MLLHKMLEQFENVGGAEKLGPITSMMMISIWRKSEKLNNKQKFSMSDRELMLTSGISKVNEFQQALNRLVTFGYIRYEYDPNNGINFLLNFNLYEPFEKPAKQNSVAYGTVMDALEKQFIQLRGTGVFVSPADYEEMRTIADTEITVEQAMMWLDECFEQYTPRFKNDSIKSFKYCSTYIHSKLAQELAKKGENGDGKHEQSSGSTSTTISSQKPKTSRNIRAREERLREKGFLRNVGNLNVDF